MTQVNRNLLVLCLIVLVAIKFLFLPWLEYLEDQKQELQTLSKKLTRSEALLLVQDDVIANEKHLTSATQALLEAIPVTQDAAAYRVEFQQQLQSTIENHGVQLILFEWLSDSDMSTLSVMRARLSIRLKGNVSDVARAHVALERQMPFVRIRDLKATWQGNLQTGQEIEFAAIVDLDYVLEPQS